MNGGNWGDGDSHNYQPTITSYGRERDHMTSHDCHMTYAAFSQIMMPQLASVVTLQKNTKSCEMYSYQLFQKVSVSLH